MFEVFKKNWVWFLLPICIILVYGLFIMFPISEDSIEKAGQFGDSFGVINTLFSGSAFIALVITIYLQQQEMRETKKETQRQNFENTFFKMIDLYKSVVKDLSLEIPRIYNGIFSDDGIEEFSYTQYKIGEVLLFRGEKDLQGKEVIDELLKIFNMYKHALKTHPKKYQISEGEYEDFYKEYENVIRHYFSTIYQILKFVDKNKNIEKEEKKDYINLFLAQIPKIELKLFYFHVKSSLESEKIMPILIKYDFIKK